ncbi:hypothetical protein LCGC14_2164280 [marine sediment metagenome]|uniref:Uncharacterized protein n=1 Tax=marine sediment metagenome TaxID=412755 RepID=A0A0F9GMZ3_9ZZZZ
MSNSIIFGLCSLAILFFFWLCGAYLFMDWVWFKPWEWNVYERVSLFFALALAFALGSFPITGRDEP